MEDAIRVDVAQSIRSFRWNEATYISLIKGEHGVVAKDLSMRAIRVEGLAKQNASGRPGPNVRTGRLRGSITWRLGVDGFGVYADIGSNVLYSAYVELGTSRMPAYPFLTPALEAARI